MTAQRPLAETLAAGAAPPPLASPPPSEPSAASPREAREADAPPCDAGLSVGEVLGRYRVTGWIGDGGQGEVYRAEHVELGTPVAIKIARRDEDGRHQRYRRFRREARLGARIRHRHVVQILETGEHDGAPYLVLELVEGEALSEILAKTTLGPAAAVELGVQLLAAVHALAEQKIVHRDIKPENIVLHRAIDGDVVVKLLDFGISKSPRVELATSTITIDGTVVGTPDYMSPEAVRGGPVDVRSDLYSVAAVLYECLAGQPPHDGETVAAVFAAILSEPIRPLRTAAPGCPHALAQAIQRGLRDDPEERFAHPSRMAERLRAVAHEEGLARGADAWAGLLEDPRAPAGTSALPLHRSRVTSKRGRGARAWIGGLWDRVAPLADRRPARFAAAALVALGITGFAAFSQSEDVAADPAGKALVREAQEEKASAANEAPAETRVESAEDDAPESLDALSRSARGLFLRGENASALHLYEQITERDPSRAEAWRDLGVVAHQLGRRWTARRALRRYLEMRPEASDAARIRRLLASTDG